MKIMVVDDSESMLQVVISMLVVIGHNDIIGAQNGAQAIERLRTASVDLIITDLKMPVMDGIKMVERLRQQANTVNLPVLMITAEEDKEVLKNAAAAGINSYIPKPFGPSQLRDKIDALINRHTRIVTQQLLAGSAAGLANSRAPLVIFGEKAVTAAKLQEPQFAAVRSYLLQALAAIKAIAQRDPDLKIGYHLADQAKEITSLLRRRRDTVRLLFLNMEMGGSLTLARLAGINRKQLEVALICERRDRVPVKLQNELKALGVYLLARSELSGDRFERLFREFVVEIPRQTAHSVPDPTGDRLESDIRHLGNLPALPEVCRRIVALDKNPDSKIQDWLNAIETDAASSAAILRRARTPLYGFREEVTRVGHAINLLGKETTRNLIMAQGMRRAFSQAQEAGFVLREFWLHSLAVAVTAHCLSFPLDKTQWTPQDRSDFKALDLRATEVQTLAQLDLSARVPLPDSKDAFMAGIMHDIGKVALVQSYPGLFAVILEELQAHNWNIPMLEAERRVAGPVDHVRTGVLLTEAWHLDQGLSAAIARHHAPEDGLSYVLALANFIGGAVYPFPARAAYPAHRIVVDGDGLEVDDADPAAPASYDAGMLKTLDAFFPDAAQVALKLDLPQALDLARLLSAAIKRQVEAISQHF